MDFIAALQKALAAPTDDGFTTQELLAKSGLSQTLNSTLKIRAFIRDELAAGRVTARTGKRMSIRGTAVVVPVFVPVPTKAKKKR